MQMNNIRLNYIDVTLQFLRQKGRRKDEAVSFGIQTKWRTIQKRPYGGQFIGKPAIRTQDSIVVGKLALHNHSGIHP
jgi:hypothetical protein